MDITQILMIIVLIVLAVVIYKTMIATDDNTPNKTSSSEITASSENTSSSEKEHFKKIQQKNKIMKENFTPAPSDISKQQDILSEDIEKKMESSNSRPGNVPKNLLVPENAFNYESNEAEFGKSNNISGWSGDKLNNEDSVENEIINNEGDGYVDDNVDNPFNEVSKEYRDLSRELTAEEQSYLDNEVLTLPGTDALAATEKALYSIDTLSTVNKNSSTDLRGEPNIQHDPNFFAPFNSSSLINNSEARISSGRL